MNELAIGFRSQDRSKWASAVLFSSAFMQLLDVSILNVAIPSIQSNLNASYSDIESIVTSYQVAFATSLLIASKLGDRYGRRRLFLIGVAGFVIASAFCGVAPKISYLIIARIFQGLFSGLMIPQVISIVQVTYIGAKRARVLGAYGGIIGLATVAGPLAGGILIRLDLAKLDWRLIFFVNIPVGIFSFVGGMALLSETRSSNLVKINYRSAATIALGIGLLVFGLVDGRNLRWPLWILADLLIAVLLIILFLVIEQKASLSGKDGLIKYSFLTQHSFALGLIVFLVFFAGITPFFFAFSIFLQEGNNYTPLAAGVTTIPFAAGAAIVSLFASRLKPELAKRLMLLGSGALIVAMMVMVELLYHVGAQLSGFQLVIPLFLAGAGLGIFMGPGSSLILSRVPQIEAGTASGAISTAQQVGGAIGIAIIGLAFFTLMGNNADLAFNSQIGSVTQELHILKISPTLISEGEHAFKICVHDKAVANDPSALPLSCEALGVGIDTAPIAASVQQKLIGIFTTVGQNIAQTDFLVSIREILWIEAMIFAIVGTLVVGLDEFYEIPLEC